MRRSLLRPVFSFAATLLLLFTFTFFLLRLLPGGPFDRERPFAPALRAELEARYGLDLPLPAQYLKYLGGALQGELGPSLRQEGMAVSEIIGAGLPVTSFLALFAFALALLCGVPLGVWAAGRAHSPIDWLIRGGAVGVLSLPSFLAAALLLYFFAYRWPIFPAAFWGGLEHRVLPLFALTLLPAAQVARLVRASVLEQAPADFLRTARAKGLSEARVLWHHALRNSLLPLCALLGPLAANLFAGTVVVETIFALPGLGASFVSAVAQRDYPLATGLTLLYGALLTALNLISEFSYSYVDPRLGRSPEAP